MAGPLPRVKEAHLAGRWYPASASALAGTVGTLLAESGIAARPGVVAILVPHASSEYWGTAARGFAAAGGGWQRAVILAPSHFASFRGAAVLPMSGYRTPLGVVPIDEEAVAIVARGEGIRANPAVFMREHALEAVLPLLHGLAPECAIVPLLLGTLAAGDGESLADLIRPILTPTTLLVVSSDLVHYGRRFGYVPVPPSDAEAVAVALRRIDDGALDRIAACDVDGFSRYVEETGATICGRHAIETCLRLLPPGARGERLGYATSLPGGGAVDHAVSYAAVSFVVGPA